MVKKFFHEIAFFAVLIFFFCSEIDFWPFLTLQKMEFLAWTFLNFLAHYAFFRVSMINCVPETEIASVEIVIVFLIGLVLIVVVQRHSALKLEKNAISKVQKTLFAFSNMAKSQFLHQKKV